MCGRRLRSARWRARGIGPVCARRNQPTHQPGPHIPTPAPDHHIPGQTELPLAHHQPSLWSL
ncbi:DUF6011 domain-containing protein [Streptomyces bacillaris]|uniref:DUF6011 domain-containing protein n=1 Tax=Streptomyces bacillaris TaxID=68179 RepID=UPI0036FACB6D